LQWWLDPRLAPSVAFQHRLWPDSELTVRTARRSIVVQAGLAPGADRRSVRPCRARLVDPARRTVIAAAPLRDAGGCLVRAEIHDQVPPGEIWVEVVDDDSRPVISAQLRHIRRAMRWADAALYAARQSPGLDDEQWARLAALAWERCASDWSAAGDPDRAYLAAVRYAAMRPDVPVPVPPAAWVRELAGRSSLTEPPFLAEMPG
jgi:hypothetical protein